MAEIFGVIGWLAVGIILLYVSFIVFFLTVDVFDKAELSGTVFKNILAIVLWTVIAVFWFKWLSFITIGV